MPPPELATDTPVLDAAHPVVVHLGPAIREEAHRGRSLRAGLSHAGLRCLHAGILEEPLFAQARLDGHIGPLAEANVVGVGLGLVQGPRGLQQFGRALATDEAVQPRQISTSLGRKLAVGREHINDRKIVAQADLEVGFVVGRGDLQHARAKVEGHVIVGDDGDDPLLLRHIQRQRTVHVFANEVRVARIVGVHGHRGVSGDRLRPGGGNGQERARKLHHLHTEVVHEALLFLHHDLLVGERREGRRAPVHHALAAVDQALLVEVHEHLLDAPRILRVHGEAGAGPIAGGTERAQLLENNSAVGLLPFPDLGHQRLAAKVVAVLDLAGLLEGLLDDVLGGDTCMIGARQPQDFLAVHARLAGEDVLDGVVENVAHGQHAGHVRGRDDDGIGGSSRGDTGRIGREAALVFPELVPLGLDGLRLVGL